MDKRDIGLGLSAIGSFFTAKYGDNPGVAAQDSEQTADEPEKTPAARAETASNRSLQQYYPFAFALGMTAIAITIIKKF